MNVIGTKVLNLVTPTSLSSVADSVSLRPSEPPSERPDILCTKATTPPSPFHSIPYHERVCHTNHYSRSACPCGPFCSAHFYTDLTDDDLNLTPNPFARPTGGGFGFGAFGHGPESPVASTPTAAPERGDRQYFHSRGDSATSDDSIQSSRPARKAAVPFIHSSQSSIATSNTSSFTKKPSFASLRNAFKCGTKTNDPPPLPPLDYNRSNSSLGYASQTLRRGPENPSPPNPRPATPGSSEGKLSNRTTRSKGHVSGRSGHSFSSSVFHSSDPGSDHGHGFNAPSSPPPLPPMPNLFTGFPRSESPMLVEPEEDKVEVDPRTPAEYALHAVFIRFATAAENKMGRFLKQPLVSLNLSHLDLPLYIHTFRIMSHHCPNSWAPELTRNLTTSSRLWAASDRRMRNLLLTASGAGDNLRTALSSHQISSVSNLHSLQHRH